MKKRGNPGGCRCCAPSSQVTGHVYSCAASGPVAGATVTLKLGTAVVGTATTDAAGGYTIPFTATGSYTITAVPPYTVDPDTAGLQPTTGGNFFANGTTQTAANLSVGPPTGYACCDTCADTAQLPKTLHLTATDGTALTLAYCGVASNKWEGCYTTAMAGQKLVAGTCVAGTYTVAIGYRLVCLSTTQLQLLQFAALCTTGSTAPSPDATCTPCTTAGGRTPVTPTTGGAANVSATATVASCAALSASFTFGAGAFVPGTATLTA